MFNKHLLVLSRFIAIFFCLQVADYKAVFEFELIYLVFTNSQHSFKRITKKIEAFKFESDWKDVLHHAQTKIRKICYFRRVMLLPLILFHYTRLRDNSSSVALLKNKSVTTKARFFKEAKLFVIIFNYLR